MHQDENSTNKKKKKSLHYTNSVREGKAHRLVRSIAMPEAWLCLRRRRSSSWRSHGIAIGIRKADRAANICLVRFSLWTTSPRCALLNFDSGFILDVWGRGFQTLAQ